MLIEPLNKRDNPGYFLNTTVEAAAILKGVDRDNVKLQLDLYHCQITEGDLTAHIRNLAGSYAHVQIAGVPDRHEPDHGEVDFTYVLSVLDQIGYDGWVGCEYRPAATTSAGLGWAQRWGVQPRSHPKLLIAREPNLRPRELLITNEIGSRGVIMVAGVLDGATEQPVEGGRPTRFSLSLPPSQAGPCALRSRGTTRAS